MSKAKSAERLGATGLSKSGMKMQIIAYRNANDIDVMFEDGAISTGKSYKYFLSGDISHKTVSQGPESRVGERRPMNCGQYATVTAYAGSRDVTVQFDDGTVREHMQYKAFLKGNIGHKAISRKRGYSAPGRIKDRVGERRPMNCGQYATITAYNSRKDITVQFDDGETREHMQYGAFLKGNIANPNVGNWKRNASAGRYIGERRPMKCGQYATVTGYAGARDITVQFDDGSTAHSSLARFRKGEIAAPVNYAGERTGECLPMKCGQYATITAYNNRKDITVQFTDGAIREHVQYSDFIKGDIANPNLGRNAGIKSALAGKRIGERRLMKCGQYATIIGYDGAQRGLTVQFDDGTIQEHKKYTDFVRGYVSPHGRPRGDHTGERRLMSCGMYAEITSYKNARDVTVKFDDGTVQKHKGYGSFLGGNIANPNLPGRGRTVQAGSMLLTETAYVHNGEYNFYCKCTRCGLHDIMTAKEAREHVCKEETDG